MPNSPDEERSADDEDCSGEKGSTGETGSSGIVADEPGVRRRSAVRAGIGTVLRIVGTCLLVALVLRGVDWRRLVALLGTLDARWWGAGIALMIGIQMIAATRWASLARPIGFDLPVSTFVRRFFEGLFFNLCLPTSIGGDLVKAYRLASSTHGRVLAGCTVLADRLSGLAALSVVAGTALLTNQCGLRAPAAVAIGGVILLVVTLSARLVVGHLDRVARWLPPGHPATSIVARLLPYQQRPGLFVTAIASSMLVQMGAAVVVACVARSVGVALPLSFWFFAVPLVALAMVLPISIGGVGIREGGLAVLLAPHGVPAEKAVAIGLLWFLMTIVMGLIGGAIFLADRRHPGGTTGDASE